MSVLATRTENSGFGKKHGKLIFAAVALLALVLSAITSGAETQRIKVNPKFAASILDKAKSDDEIIDSGCYLFRTSDLEGIATSGWYISGTKWTNGIVYYSFNPDGMTDFKKNQFRLAADAWEEVAAVAFIEVPFGNEGVTNYIEVNDHPSKNNSFIGMIGGKQVLNIVNWNWTFIIAHEIGHALGQWHEHTRSDRNTYINVDFDNIKDNIPESNWEIQLGIDEGTAYDFESVMHYGPSSGAKDGTTIISAADTAYQTFFDQGLVGQRDHLSDGDIQGMVSRYGGLVPAQAPGIDFPSGTWNVASITLTLELPSDYDPNLSTFYFTTDGSDPTDDSEEWQPTAGFLLRNSATVKVVHYRKTKSPSAITEREYTLQNPTPLVETPEISPASGTYNSSIFVTITTATDGADIYYTTNATIPTENSTKYEAPFSISQSLAIKARAFKTGYTRSDIVTNYYDITPSQLPPPIIDPSEGTYNGSVILSIYSTVQGATVRYTTDGSEPTATSNPIDENPVTLTQSATVKAKAFRTGFTDSATTQKSYTIIASADTPVISPAGGSHTGSPNITISASPVDALIRYTTNGSEPTAYSTLYTGSFTLPFGTHTVKAKAFLLNAGESSTKSETFTIYDPNTSTVSNPYFRPLGRDHIGSVQVEIFCDTEGADIHYTIGDGVAPPDPTTGDPKYTTPFNLGKPTVDGSAWFLRAKAFKTGSTASAVIPKTLFVYDALGTINPPTIDPNGGTFNNSVQVTLEAETVPPTVGIQYYYETNGDDPYVPDPPAGGLVTQFTLSKPAKVKALAYRSFFGASTITESEDFYFVCANPTATPEENGHIDSVEVSMTCDTTNARIRYSLDGSEPEDDDEISPKYTAPFQLGIGTHIVRMKAFRFNFDPSETVTQVYVVEPEPVAPNITEHPASQTVDQGTNVMFSCSATGVPDPDFQWQKDGIDIAGATTTTLQIPNVNPDDGGEYRAIVSNKAGSTTSTAALLTVNAVITPTPTVTPTPDADLQGWLLSQSTSSEEKTINIATRPVRLTPTSHSPANSEVHIIRHE